MPEKLYIDPETQMCDVCASSLLRSLITRQPKIGLSYLILSSGSIEAQRTSCRLAHQAEELHS